MLDRSTSYCLPATAFCLLRGTTMLKVGILGAGFMGSTHARALNALSDVEIVGIYGLSEGRAKPLAEELGTSWTADLGHLIDDESIDAIDICLPTPQHRVVA